MSERRITPFSTGSQYVFWVCQNCDACFKGYDHEAGRYNCDIQEALDEAGIIGDGTVSAEIAGRMGITDKTRLAYSWRCGEFSRDAGITETRPADVPGQRLLF